MYKFLILAVFALSMPFQVTAQEASDELISSPLPSATSDDEPESADERRERRDARRERREKRRDEAKSDRREARDDRREARKERKENWRSKWKEKREQWKYKVTDRMKEKSPACAALVESKELKRRHFKKCVKAEKNETFKEKVCEKKPDLAFCGGSETPDAST